MSFKTTSGTGSGGIGVGSGGTGIGAGLRMFLINMMKSFIGKLGPGSVWLYDVLPGFMIRIAELCSRCVVIPRYGTPALRAAIIRCLSMNSAGISYSLHHSATAGAT